MENLMPTWNKLTKNKALMLKIDISCDFHSSPRGEFRTMLSIKGGNLVAKMVNDFKSINIFAKSSVSDAYTCSNRIPSWFL